MKTKAAVLYEANTPLVIEELDLDEPKGGEVLVKIGAAGICRSDWHFMAGEAKVALPAVLGHEGSGVGGRVGPGGTSGKAGEPVILSCGPGGGRGKVGPKPPCPCGSGKKSKRCHGASV